MRPLSASTSAPSLLALLLISVSAVLGDVVFTSPAPGASVAGGSTFTVTWKDSGVAPLITDLLSYNLLLYSGSNAAPQPLFSLKTGTFAEGNSITVTVPIASGGPGVNV